MGFFDRPLFDFNGDGETDFMEWSIGMQMTASSRQEAIDLTGDDAFYSGSDTLEEEGDDDARHYIGDDGIDGEGAYAAAQLLGHHRGCGCRGTDDADKHALEHESEVGVRGERDEPHKERRERHTDGLQPEMPGARTHLLYLYLTERDIKEHEEHYRNQRLQ